MITVPQIVLPKTFKCVLTLIINNSKARKFCECKFSHLLYHAFVGCFREVTPEMLEIVKDLPESFDWRNKGGESYVTPIRNQGQCGSCYSFASMACLESGVAIATNGRIKPVFSPQYVVSCSNYSQGCDGGRCGFLVVSFVVPYLYSVVIWVRILR